MPEENTVTPRLQQLLEEDIVQKLPPYIRLAQPMPVVTNETKKMHKRGKSHIHQTNHYDLYSSNKPLSKSFDPQLLSTNEE